MALISIITGVLLILLGVLGYGFAAFSGNASVTALIPALFGIVLALLGVVAKMKDSLRKHIMHVAVLVGLIGFLATVSSVLSIGDVFAGTSARPAAVISKLIMSLICLVFVVLCVKSFIDARRSGAV